MYCHRSKVRVGKGKHRQGIVLLQCLMLPEIIFWVSSNTFRVLSYFLLPLFHYLSSLGRSLFASILSCRFTLISYIYPQCHCHLRCYYTFFCKTAPSIALVVVVAKV